MIWNVPQLLHTDVILLQKVEKLKSLCLRYATSIQLLIPSISMQPERDTKSATTARMKKSQLKEQQPKLVLENTAISDSIMYIISLLPYL